MNVINEGIVRLRSLAIISVIFVHSYPFDVDKADFLLLACLDLLKFGTISFFIASGYLLGGDKYKNFDDFFKARFKTVFVPWLIWIFIYTAIVIGREWIQNRDIFFWQMLYRHLFHTSYWFVINFFCAAWVYSKTSKSISSRSQFAIFLVFSVFYAVNVHLRWVMSSHTMAVFGYVVFIHLGVFACRYESCIRKYILKWRNLLFALTVIFAIVSVFESFVLFKNGSGDVVNTLRISNQIYSSLIAMVLLFASTPMLPTWLSERSMTFSLYLIHPVVMLFVSIAKGRVISLIFPNALDLLKPDGQYFVFSQYMSWIVTFLVVYILSVALVILMKKLGFSYLIGSNNIKV